uniref:X-ray repair cross-complementing protein 5 n=1 Tax=Euleptes europaea TaxID=460621 RepID=UPI002542101E|nr:X-ray repair cross-complementing protein 5 [Euleptes europaea]
MVVIEALFRWIYRMLPEIASSKQFCRIGSNSNRNKPSHDMLGATTAFKALLSHERGTGPRPQPAARRLLHCAAPEAREAAGSRRKPPLERRCPAPSPLSGARKRESGRVGGGGASCRGRRCMMMFLGYFLIQFVHFLLSFLKAAIVLCMDVGSSMSNVVPGEESPFEQAKKVMTLFVQRQVFAESKDEIALVLFGTDGTENTLASNDQYQHITVHRHLFLPDFHLLEDIQNVIQPGSGQGDILDAVIVCMDLLQKETIGKKYDKRHIEVFTDLSSPFSEDQLDIIVANMKKTGISLQFFLPFPMNDKDGSGDANDEARSSRHQNSFPRKGLTEQQKEGLLMVKKLMFALDKEDGLEDIYTFRESLERLSMFKKIERRPMAWPCQLTIGSKLSVRIIAYKSITEEKVKKSWMVVDAKTLKKDDVQKETVHCLNDDDETEVQKEDIIQGFRYGSDIIPFSKVDEEQMKYKTDGKCFAVLGFSRSSQVLRHHYMGSQVLKVFATKDDEAAAVALSSLIHALNELDMVAIVRYVYDRRSNPQVGVAFPLIKNQYECLVYVQLPYMEDLRQYMFSSLKNNKKCTPTEDQLCAVDSLVDSMNLVYEDEREETMKDIFKTSKFPNPQFQRLFQCLQHKAFHPDAPLPPIEKHLIDMLETPQEVMERCQVPLQKLKGLFPLNDVGKIKEQKTAQSIFKDNSEDRSNVKKAKTEDDEGDFNIENLAEGKVTTVGSVNPTENFRVLVRQKNVNFKEVSQQLINHIHQFLENRELYYMKSINCIKVFREEAVKLSQVQCFNGFLEALKKKVEDKNLPDFWEIIIQDNISLITKEEAEGSSVTVEDAKKFLAPKEKAMEISPIADEGGDVDDLLDMI